MPTPLIDPAPSDLLSDLATQHAGASRVFHRHGLDFCCHGRRRLDEACAAKDLDVEDVLAQLRASSRETAPERWDERPLETLVAHILATFHAAHRADLPRLVEMARKVERVHADKDSRPAGLAQHLETVRTELEAHMEKEEQVLFPLIVEGRGRTAATPIHVLELEHLDHARNLARLRELAHDFAPPADACSTWRALYLGLAALERDVMEHIHLENNVLFPRALRD